jgi:hypothetical protein
MCDRVGANASTTWFPEDHHDREDPAHPHPSPSVSEHSPSTFPFPPLLSLPLHSPTHICSLSSRYTLSGSRPTSPTSPTSPNTILVRARATREYSPSRYSTIPWAATTFGASSLEPCDSSLLQYPRVPHSKGFTSPRRHPRSTPYHSARPKRLSKLRATS